MQRTLAAQLAKENMTNLAIYEPVYEEGQQLSEPTFRPLLLRGNPYALTREFGILLHMYRLGLH